MNTSQASPEKLERLTRLLQLDPTNQSLRRRCIDAASALGQFDLLVQLADSSLEANSRDAEALFARATGLIGQQQYRSALEALKSAEEIAGPDGAILMNIGLCHYCLGEFEQAKVHLDECYRAGMRTPGLLRLLVSSCHHIGMLDEGVRIAHENDTAAESDGGLAGVYALLYLDADDAMRASRWARVALQANPKSIDGRVTEAMLSIARMQTERAKQMLESVVEDAPTTGRAWVGLGVLHLLERRLDRAKEHLVRGTELMPDYVGSWHVLGWIEILSGELDAAEQALQRAVEVDGDFAEAHGSLAIVAAARGEREHARQLIEAALKLDSECFSAKLADAFLDNQSGDAGRTQKLMLDAVTNLATKDTSALGKLLLKTVQSSASAPRTIRSAS